MMPQLQDQVTALDKTQQCVARALYDNIAESPDELAFRKGDLLTVLEQNTASIEGWWLCSLRGRQGICPGNRLRIIAGVYHSPSLAPTPSPELIIHQDFNTLQRQGKRRSWHVQPNKVLTPQKFGDVYLYDCPPTRTSPCQTQGRYDVPAHLIDQNQGRYAVPPSRSCSNTPLGRSCDTPLSLRSCDSSLGSQSCNTPVGGNPDFYDVPPRLHPLPVMNYDTPKSCDTPRSSATPAASPSDCYDVPRPHPPNQQLTPSSSASSLTTADSMSSSNRSSRVESTDYDVPRPSPKGGGGGGPKLQLFQIDQQLYDVPQSVPVPRELPLELNSALDSLARLQTEATSAISKLLGFAGPNWRRRDRLEPRLMDVKLAVVRLRTSLHDLADFGRGALGNAGRCPDRGLAAKLGPLVTALRDADRLVQGAAAALDEMRWDVDALSRDDDNTDGVSKLRGPPLPDALDQLVACARALTEDVRQTASFVQGNSTLLFKRSANNNNNNNNTEWLEDYDYVNLESKEAVERQHADIISELPNELRKSYDQLVKEAEQAAVISDAKKEKETPENELDPNDRQVLNFYAAQTVTHTMHLTHAIDAFLQTVEHNQPPKVFLAHSKFVVLSAHRLVHIGDTVHRNVRCVEVRTRVLNCANALSESLATTVGKTKTAAIQFPSVTAVQEMVDSVVDVSHLARDLKLSMVQAASHQPISVWRN